MKKASKPLVASQLTLRCSHCHSSLTERITGALLGKHCRRCGIGLLLAATPDPPTSTDRPSLSPPQQR